jgi:hypothetical protein
VIEFLEQQTGVDVEVLLERNVTGALGDDSVGALFDNVSGQLLGVARRLSKDETIPMVTLMFFMCFWKMLRLVSCMFKHFLTFSWWYMGYR